MNNKLLTLPFLCLIFTFCSKKSNNDSQEVISDSIVSIKNDTIPEILTRQLTDSTKYFSYGNILLPYRQDLPLSSASDIELAALDLLRNDLELHDVDHTEVARFIGDFNDDEILDVAVRYSFDIEVPYGCNSCSEYEVVNKVYLNDGTKLSLVKNPNNYVGEIGGVREDMLVYTETIYLDQDARCCPSFTKYSYYKVENHKLKLIKRTF